MCPKHFGSTKKSFKTRRQWQGSKLLVSKLFLAILSNAVSRRFKKLKKPYSKTTHFFCTKYAESLIEAKRLCTKPGRP